MKNLLLLICFFSLSLGFINAQDIQEPKDGNVGVYVLRDKAFYGGAVKWPIYVADGATHRELDSTTTFKANKYLRENMVGSVKKKEYVFIEIPANKESIIYVGEHYLYADGKPGSILFFTVAGVTMEVGLYKGETRAGMGTSIANAPYFKFSYEEEDLEPQDNMEATLEKLSTYDKIDLEIQ